VIPSWHGETAMSCDKQSPGECQVQGGSNVLAWCAGGLVAAVVVGCTGAVMQLAGLAPVVILPLALGGVLGIVLSSLSVSMGLSCPKRLVTGTIVLAMFAVLAEHAWLYRDFRRQWQQERANNPNVAMFRPETPSSPAEYFARESSPGRIALWCVDAVFLIGSALVAVVIVGRRSLAKFAVAADLKHNGMRS
jgi:hypothetical protein